MNPFWREVIEIWDVFKRCFAISSQNIYKQPLLLSSFIKRGHEVVWNNKLLKSGSIFVGDLWSSTGQELTYDDFKRDYRISTPMIEHMGNGH